VVCCAACIAGDNLQDLKCGHIIGASPWRQQVMLGIGALSCALIMAPVLNLLLKAYGMGPATPAHPQSLQAAQATLMEAVSRAMFGGQLPWSMVLAGVGVGAAIIVCDEILKARKAGFRTPVLAAAVGIYLPIELSVPIFFGGVLAWLAERTIAAAAVQGVAPVREEAERVGRKGMLFAAGLITGEALIGVLIAIPIVTTGRDDVFALPPELRFGGWLGLAILAALSWWLFRVATDRGPSQRIP